jgi:hypothetical protein
MFFLLLIFSNGICSTSLFSYVDGDFFGSNLPKFIPWIFLLLFVQIFVWKKQMPVQANLI